MLCKSLKTTSYLYRSCVAQKKGTVHDQKAKKTQSKRKTKNWIRRKSISL